MLPVVHSPSAGLRLLFAEEAFVTDPWSPAQYDRYADERRQPFFDLLALLEVRPGGRVVDLGCGTGELTRILHEQTRARETLGLDSSAAMLAASGAHAGGGLSFATRDVSDFGAPAANDGTFDVVFSNACLQWIDDHDALFARIASTVAPGGQLAIQMPSNHDHPSHLVAAEVARQAPFAAALAEGPRRSPVQSAAVYASMLFRHGFAERHVRLQVYGHELPSREDVVQWVKGTLLTHYERQLGPERWPRFLESYRERLFEVLPDERPFFFPFPRLMLWARRAY